MTDEILRLGLAALLGLALGFFYDLLRPPRRRVGAIAGALLDLTYALTAGAGCFFFAMSAGNGRMGLWELVCVLLGLLGYWQLFSPAVLGSWEGLLRKGWSIMRFCKKRLKKSGVFVKKYFQNLSK